MEPVAESRASKALLQEKESTFNNIQQELAELREEYDHLKEDYEDKVKTLELITDENQELRTQLEQDAERLNEWPSFWTKLINRSVVHFYFIVILIGRENLHRNVAVATNKCMAEEFTFAELAKATKNFRLDYFVGKGGFDKVYRGHLERINQDVTISSNLILKEFKESESLQSKKDFVFS
ncbi:hypothetical protein ACFE04_002270 [Oxalis oulophora]